MKDAQNPTIEPHIEVDVEKIMADIREKLRAARKEAEEHAVMPAAEPSFLEDVSYINQNWNIPYYWKFTPAGIKTFFKRVVRRLGRCVLLPILERQNQLNGHTVRCINFLADRLEQTEEAAYQLGLQVEELQNELDREIRIHEAYVKDEKERLDAMRQSILEEVTQQLSPIAAAESALAARMDSIDRQSP